MNTAPEPARTRLGGRALRAFGWSLLNNILVRAGTFLIGVLVARLLGPEQFGTFAVALVALGIVLSFNELGVSLAVVRWREAPDRILPTVNTISVLASGVLFAALYLTAPLVADVVGQADASGIIRLLAVSVLFSGAVAGPAALLERDFKQRRRLLIDQTVTWTGGLVSVVLVLMGHGAWGLAWGRVAGTAVGLILFIGSSRLPYRFGLDREYVGRLLRFGLPLAGTSLLMFAAVYLEQVIVGGRLGAVALGFYALAFNLAAWPINIFSAPLRSVAPATFARMQGDQAAMNSGLITIFTVLCMVVLPTCLLIGLAADELVLFIYGGPWRPAAEILRVLCLVAFLRIVMELVYDFLVVLQRTGYLFLVQAAWLTLLVPVLWWTAANWGARGVAAGQLGLLVGLVIPLYLWTLRRVGVPTWPLLRALLIPGAVTLIAAAPLLWYLSGDPRPIAGVAVTGLVGAVVLAVLAVLNKSSLTQVRGMGAAPVAES